MRLKHLSLRNFGRLTEADVRFGRMTAIVGPNGCGKSTIFRAVRGCFTGDFHDECPKAGAVSQFASAKEPSYVKLVLSANGSQDCTVTRHLRPDKQTLEQGDPEPIRKAAEVTSRMLELAGVSRHVLDKFVFIAQGTIDSLFAGTRAERAAACARLFGAERAEKVATTASAAFNRAFPGCRDEASVIAAQVANTAQWDGAHRRNVELAEALQVLQAVPDYPAGEDPDLKVLEQERVAKAAEWRRDAAQQRGAVEHAAAAPIAAQLDSVLSDLQTIRGALASDNTNTVELAQALGRWQRYRQQAEQRASITRQREQCLAVALPPEPTQPAGYLDPASSEFAVLDRSLGDRRAERQAAKSFADAWSGNKQCPTCGGDVSHLAREAEAAAINVERLTSQIDHLQKRLADSRHYARDAAAWAACAELQRSRLTQIEASLASLGTGQPPADEPESVLLDKAAKRQQMEDAERTFAGEESRLAQDWARKNAAAEAASREMIAAEEERVRNAVTAEQVAAARLAYDERCRARGERERLKAEQQAATREWQRLHEEGHALEQELKTCRQVGVSRGVADGALQLLGRNGWARSMSERGLRRLALGGNEFLEAFGAPFRINAGEDLTIEARYADGRRVPSSLLSGGEKVVLGLSCAMVVNTLFAAEAGFLFLDEPTVFLDRDNIKALHQVLDKLAGLAASRNLQVVLITHEASLVPHFDTVVDLSARAVAEVANA